MNDLLNKVAIVTGAGTGVAARIAQAYAAHGALVVLTYTKGREAAESAVASIIGSGGQAAAVQADVSRIESVTRLFDHTEALFGRPDIVMNTAGCDALSSPSRGADLFSLLLVTGHAVHRFGTAGGSIINIAALEGQAAANPGGVYVSAQGPIDPIALGLSRTLQSKGIRVNSIAVGAPKRALAMVGSGACRTQRDTDPHTDTDADGEGDADAASMSDTRVDDDIARMAVFLASEKASYLSGECIVMPENK